MIQDKIFRIRFPKDFAGKLGIAVVSINPKIIANWECHHNLFTSPSSATLTLKAAVPGEKIRGVYVSPNVMNRNKWDDMKPKLFHRSLIHTTVEWKFEWRLQAYFLDFYNYVYPLLPMMEIEVLQRVPSDLIKFIPDEMKENLPRYPLEGEEWAYYLPSWKGYIDGITTSFSGGEYIHTIILQDILHWYNLSRVNIRPSMVYGWSEGEYYEAATIGANLTFSTNLASYSLKEVLKAVLGFEGAEGKDNPFLGGVNKFLLDLAKQSNAWFTLSDKTSQLYESVRDQYNTSGERKDTFQQGDLVWSRNLVRIDRQIQEGDFSQIIPYQIAEGGEDVFQHDFKTRLEILNELKEALSLEIFMDTTTELIVKLPSYNESIPVLPTTQPIFDFALRKIPNEDIISMSLSEAPSEAVNFLIFTGESWSKEVFMGLKEPYLKQINRVNANSIRRYMVRAESASSPYTTTQDEIRAYSKFLMEKMNVDIFQGTVTTTSRPGIRLGRTILFDFGYTIGKKPPLTMIGYVVSIDEQWQPGSHPIIAIGIQAVRENGSDANLYTAFPYSDFETHQSTRYYAIEEGGLIQDLLLLFYTKPKNSTVILSVIEDNRPNFKEKYKTIDVSEALVKEIKDLFKDGITHVTFKGVDK